MVQQLAAEAGGNVIPVFSDLSADLLTPITAYLRLSHSKPYSFLFESVLGGEKLGRYSFLGTDPYKVITTGQNGLQGDPLIAIEKELAEIKYVPVPGVQNFTGGAIGYISYDCVRFFEPRSARSTPNLKDTLSIPDSVLMFCDTIVVFDHLYQTLRVVSHVRLDSDNDFEMAYSDAGLRIQQTVQRLSDPSPCLPEQGPITLGHEAVSNVGKDGYEGFVKELKKYITEGDIIQAVRFRFSLYPACNNTYKTASRSHHKESQKRQISIHSTPIALSAA